METCTFLVLDNEPDTLMLVERHIKRALQKYNLAGRVVQVLCANIHQAEYAIRQAMEEGPVAVSTDYAFEDERQTPPPPNGADLARWVKQQYGDKVPIATHTNRHEDEARQLFAGTCVRFFMGMTKESMAVEAEIFVLNCYNSKPA